MKSVQSVSRLCFALVGLFWFGALVVRATDRYVVEPGNLWATSGIPYNAWTNAATNIQWAVDAAVDGETVWVSNGSYRVTNQITLTNAITLQSVNGTNFTFVNGNYPNYTNRCFYITNAAGIIDGFTITNGYYISTNAYDGGGGVKLYYNGTLRNCVIKDNTSSNDAASCGGGGVYLYSGGMVSNCVIVSNTAFGTNAAAPAGGGGIHVYSTVSSRTGLVCNSFILNNSGGYGGGACLDNSRAIISNCTVAGNTARTSAGGVANGGLILNSLICNNTSSNEEGGIGQAGGTIRDSVISNNTARTHSGGIRVWFTAVVSNCIITGNSATNSSSGVGGGVRLDGDYGRNILANNIIYANRAGYEGGGVYSLYGNTVRNCLIYNNTNQQARGGGVCLRYATNTIVQSCTIAGNQAGTLGGGLYSQGTNQIENCIIYNNVTTNDAYDDVYNESDRNTNDYYYCCAPTNLAVNQGNITNDPQMVNVAGGNWRLSQNSPCVNTGTNQDWMTNAVDLDGLSRKVQGTVDIGAYESEYYFSLGPTVSTNTVMRGSTTNLSIFLTNSSNTQIYWQAANTSSWLTLGASGMIGTNATYNATVTNVITNNSLGLNPTSYYSRLIITPTNIAEAMRYYPQTGTVDLTLNVAEFWCSVTTLTATVRQFGATSDTVRIWNSGAGELSYTVSTSASWLAVSPTSGVLTGLLAGATNDLTVVFTNTSLPVGIHYGTLTFVPVIAGPPLDIDVELTVTTGPQMTVNPMILTGAVMMGQNLTNQTLRVSNVSTTEQIGYNVTADKSWLTVSPTNGTLAYQTTNELTVSYPTSGLTTNSAGGPSNYNATITVTATNPADAIGSPAEVAVNLTVNPKSRLNLSTTLLTNIVAEGYDASDCTFEIWNGNGYYTLSYTNSDNADWFTLTPASGTSTGEHDVITVEFSTAGFTAGVSNALITVVGRAYDGTHFDSALDATQTVAILLTITPAVELATDALSTYEFSARFGRPAGSTRFQVWNASAGGGTLQWTIATNASWLAARPASGASAGESNAIILACNADNLRPGKYAGALTISGIDQAAGTEARNSPANINVELTILAEKGFDFGGDGAGASDLIVYQESSGLWNITNLFSGYTTNVIFGGKGYVPVPGDFDSDAISDLGAYRYSSGYWYVRPITDQELFVCGGSYWAGPELASLGGYVSVAGDYDGDGKTDPAMYQEISGLWSMLLSASGYTYISGTFGGPGSTAVPADYDGDGKTDPAVYNDTSAQWYLLYSSDNYRIISGTFGGPGFNPVPADYDGDGLADVSIYEEATGLWIILPSSTLSSRGYAPVTGVFGGPGFNPVPADYDGDGKDDLCVYDEATGNWYIISFHGTVVAWPARHGGYGFVPVKP